MMMLTERRPILLANAHILDPSRDLKIDGDLLIADGVIREAKRGIGAAGVPEATEVIDCKGKLVAPGLVDMRAFIGEPGAEYRETIASASQAAAAGGVTTIVSQPNTAPAIDDPAIVDFVLRRARDTSIVHVQPMAALTKGLRGEEMAEIGLLKAAGAVAFTDGAKSVTNAQVMRRALTYAPDFDALAVHPTEDPHIVGERLTNERELPARLRLAEASPGGIGLETMLTAGLRPVHSGELAQMTLLKAMSSAPAKILGLAAGTLRQGSPADVIVLDPDVPWVLDPAELKSKCKNTPFDEAKLEGRVVRTIVAGRTVYEYV